MKVANGSFSDNSLDSLMSESIAQKLEDWKRWYWDQGGKTRAADYELSPAIWLDNLYRESLKATRLEEAKASNRATFALWGPSQTGKSTFLALFLDYEAGPMGENSALSWDENSPVRFVVPPGLGVDEKKPISLNPHNAGADASGCVTRFVLVDKESPQKPGKYPVRLRLAQAKEVVHMLAAGFASECKGGEIQLSLSEVEKQLPRQATSDHPTEAAYDVLQMIASVLEDLGPTGLTRYANFHGKDLEQFRQRLFSNKVLLGDADKAWEFAKWVFWDGSKAISKACDEMLAILSKIRSFHGKMLTGKSSPRARCGDLYCSFEVAEALLDIASYSKLINAANAPDTTSEERLRLESLVNSLSLTSENEELVLDDNRSGADLLEFGSLGKQELFAYLQAVIWEMVVPLRADVIKNASPNGLFHLMQKADILDLPGVSNDAAGQNVEPLSEEQLRSEESRHEIFAKVVKRGKTFAIVTEYARSCVIDGFTIFARRDRPPGSPKLLNQGVNVWWSSLTGIPLARAVRRELPLNLVVSFLAELFNLYFSNKKDILPESLDQTKKLGQLSNPDVVRAFPVVYPFEEIRDSYAERTPSKADLLSAAKDIKSSRPFSNLFGDRTEIFDLIAGAGSTREACLGAAERVLRQLIEDLNFSQRVQQVDLQLKEVATRFEALMAEALPPETAEEDPKFKDVSDWIDALTEALNEDFDHYRLNQGDDNRHGSPGESVCLALRKLLQVEPEKLDPFPSGGRNIVNYLDTQLKRWVDSKSEFSLESLREIGLRDPSQARRIVRYFAESIDVDSLAKWILTRMLRPNAQWTMDERRACRRYLAILLERHLYGLEETRSPQLSPDQKSNTLAAFSRNEFYGYGNLRSSPFYHAFIFPFLHRLDRLKSGSDGAGGRPPQPGDEEALKLAKEHRVKNT